ncbi:MAG: hypothetical protein EHM14_01785 [Methanothrix sp.]|nr:MAG: hypothetical protein EHM14_01785 [Methanothrix sp.]
MDSLRPHAPAHACTRARLAASDARSDGPEHGQQATSTAWCGDWFPTIWDDFQQIGKKKPIQPQGK